MLSTVGVGIGGMFVAVALLVLLGHMEATDALGADQGWFPRVVAAFVLPLGVTFAGVVLFQVLRIV